MNSMGIIKDDGYWTLKTSHADYPTIKARIVINCAGNFNDVVEEINRPSPFKVTPRKGQFLAYSKQSLTSLGVKDNLLNHIILPIPTAR